MNWIKPNNKNSLYSISGGTDDDAWDRELTRGGKI